jgi:hypothetical protein
MKEDAEVKIVCLESELLCWQSNYVVLAESDKHLWVESDHYMGQAVSLRTDFSSCENECEKFRAEINDLKWLLDKECHQRKVSWLIS